MVDAMVPDVRIPRDEPPVMDADRKIAGRAPGLGNADTSSKRAKLSSFYEQVLDLCAVDEVHLEVVVTTKVSTASRPTAFHRSVPGSSM